MNNLFIEKPGYLKWGIKKLSKKFGLSKEQIIKMKEQTKFIPFQEPGMYVSIGCVHVPFHNRKAMDLFFRFLEDNKNEIKGLIIAGDFLDMSSTSRHNKGKRSLKGIDLGKEYKEGNYVLDVIDQIIPNAHKAFIYGNHENNFDRLLADSDMSKLGDALISPAEGLNLYKRNYFVYKDWINDYIQVGKYLDIYHGEFCTQNPCKKALDTYRKSVLFYHTHRISSLVESNIAAYNGGNMIDKHHEAFSYASKAMKESWNNGFNVINIDEDGFFHMNQVIIYNDKFYFGTKKYS